MTQTHDETQAELNEIVALMVEKEIERPEADFTIRANEKPRVWLKGKGVRGGQSEYELKAFGTIDEARAYVLALPDRETAARQAWQAKLAKVIDEGQALALPDDVMTPLRQGSQAMTENLLAAPEDHT